MKVMAWVPQFSSTDHSGDKNSCCLNTSLNTTDFDSIPLDSK